MTFSVCFPSKIYCYLWPTCVPQNYLTPQQLACSIESDLRWKLARAVTLRNDQTKNIKDFIEVHWTAYLGRGDE